MGQGLSAHSNNGLSMGAGNSASRGMGNKGPSPFIIIIILFLKNTLNGNILRNFINSNKR